MSATTIFFNGRVISKPGSYSEIDATALETVGLGASGIVALLGLSEGGRPHNAVVNPNDDLQRASASSTGLRLFRSGDLREMSPILFSPSRDPLIPAGAQEIVYVKVNPAAQSLATFVDDLSADSLTITSKDWGLFTTQIQVVIEDATLGAPAKKITITLEDAVEVFDDLGTVAKFTLQYATGATTAQRMVCSVDDSSFQALFERDDLGQDNLVTTQATGGASLEILSDNAGDTTQTVTVFGLDGSGTPQSQVATLNGTTPVALPGTWNLETAVVLSATALGTVTVRVASGGAVVFDVPTLTLEEGRAVTNIIVEDPPGGPTTLTIESDGASTQQAVVRGIAQNTQALAEAVTITGTTPVALVGLFGRITSVELADVEVAQTLTIKGRSINAVLASTPNLQQLKDKVNAEADFTLVPLIGNPKEFLLTELDNITGVDVKNPATGSYFARVFDIVTEINLASQLVTAARAAPGNKEPDNTAAPVFLVGGHEGDALQPGVPTAQTSDWIAAIDLLKQVRVNTLTLATSDAAIHALGDAHAAFMGGIGRSERDVIVGAAPLETRAQLKTRALDLNSRHTRVWAQEVDLFNTAGERTKQDPKFGAAVLAGMQAGSPVGEPLTSKFMAILGLTQSSDWNPIDDAEELIQGGVVFGELIDGQGFKVVRNVTTHLSTSNIAFTEASVNEAVNFAAFNFRTAMETAVGKRGFAGTVNAAKAVAVGILDELQGNNIIVASRNLIITLVLDVLEVEVEIAPVLPINFVKNTIHLVTVPQTAA